MKSLTILMIITLSACSTPEKTEEECKCNMTTYETGEPDNFDNIHIVDEREVFCQDEQSRVSIGSDLYFDVVCTK